MSLSLACLATVREAHACTRSARSTVETKNFGGVRRMPQVECGRKAEESVAETLRNDAKIRYFEGSDIQNEIKKASAKTKVVVTSGAVMGEHQSDTSVEKTNDSKYTWRVDGILWNIELDGCTASDVYVKEGSCMALVSGSSIGDTISDAADTVSKFLGRRLLCDHGNNGDGFCSAKVTCNFRAYTNDLDSNCEPPPAPVVPGTAGPANTGTTTNPPGGGGVGGAAGHECNFLAACQTGLNCKDVFGLPCILPIACKWGGCGGIPPPGECARAWRRRP